jgi:hypothetical protein
MPIAPVTHQDVAMGIMQSLGCIYPVGMNYPEYCDVQTKQLAEKNQ